MECIGPSWPSASLLRHLALEMGSSSVASQGVRWESSGNEPHEVCQSNLTPSPVPRAWGLHHQVRSSAPRVHHPGNQKIALNDAFKIEPNGQ